MRKRIAALVVAAMAITTIAFAGSADAATAPATTIATAANTNHPGIGPGQGIRAGGHLLTAPPAPRSAPSRSIQPACCTYPGISPWISPGVATFELSPGSTYICNYGDLCTLVWDPTTEAWKLFQLYDCHYYSLYYWNGQGYFYDNQSGNVWSTFYGNGSQITQFTVDQAGHQQWPENWGPVDHIENC